MGDTASSGTVIETARLRLRMHRDADLSDLVSQVAPWNVAGWLAALPSPYTDEHGREWIAHVRQSHAAGHPRAFAIALKETDQLIGGVGLDGTSGDHTDEPSLGYWLGTSYQGHGYAREAILAYVFRSLGLDTIRGVTDPENTPSQNVLIACRLRLVGDIDLPQPTRRGARRVPLFCISRHYHTLRIPA